MRKPRAKFTVAAYQAGLAGLIAHLKTVPLGERVPYADVTKIVGYNIETRRAVFYAARDKVAAETGKTFAKVANVGWLCVPVGPAAETAETPETAAPAQPSLPALNGPAPAVEVQPLPGSPWEEVWAAMRRAVLHEIGVSRTQGPPRESP